MKFEITEVVAVQNPDEVLRILEKHLRSVAGEVVRAADQLTAYGIGPSPRTVNRRDTTVVEARAENGTTLLCVRVNYQASALLGNMPQDGIVRSKIEGAIDEMRGELKVWKPWVPPIAKESTDPTRADFATAPPDAISAQEERSFEHGSGQLDQAPIDAALLSPEIAAQPDPVAESQSVAVVPVSTKSQLDSAEPKHIERLGEPVSQASREVVADTPQTAEATELSLRHSSVLPVVTNTPMVPERKAIRLSKTRRKVARRGAADTISAPTPTVFPAIETKPASEVPQEKRPASTVRDVPLQGLLRGQGLEERREDTKPKGHRRSVFLSLLLLLIALGTTVYFLRDMLPIPATWRSAATNLSAQVTDKVAGWKDRIGGNAPANAAPVAQAKAPVEVTGTSDVTDPEVMVRPQSNVYLWIQDWAAALRSRDPVAQASYYADPVDVYLKNGQVTRAFVMRDKSQQIRDREGLYTIKIEHIYIERQTSTEARIRVVKHRILKAPAGNIQETLVKSRLRLVRDGNTWKISQEEDL